MAINDSRTAPTTARQFGRGNAPQNSTAADKPKAQLWINIGVEKDVMIDGQPTTQFIALPQGIPVDTMELRPATSRNDEFRNRELAQNALHKLVMQKAAELAPGEDVIINLQVQLRRVNADVVPTSDDENPYVANISL